MAHGPVNRAWYIQITPDWCIKVNETQYKNAIDYYTDRPITVVIGQRTDRTLYLCDISADELQKAGFTQKGNRVWGMLSEIDYDFSE